MPSEAPYDHPPLRLAVVQPQAAGSGLLGAKDQGEKESTDHEGFSCHPPPRWSLPFDVYHISPVTGWNVMPTLLRIPARKRPITWHQPRR